MCTYIATYIYIQLIARQLIQFHDFHFKCLRKEWNWEKKKRNGLTSTANNFFFFYFICFKNIFIRKKKAMKRVEKKTQWRACTFCEFSNGNGIAAFTQFSSLLLPLETLLMLSLYYNECQITWKLLIIIFRMKNILFSP